MSGAPLVTPDGTMVAVLNAAADRVHTLKARGPARPLHSQAKRQPRRRRRWTLAHAQHTPPALKPGVACWWSPQVGASAQKADDGAVQDILPGFAKGGLSRMAFVNSATDGKLAVLTSTADNFALVRCAACGAVLCTLRCAPAACSLTLGLVYMLPGARAQVLNLDTFALTTLSLPVPNDGNSSSAQGHGAAREVVAGLSQADGKMYALIAASRMRWLHTVTLGAQGAQGQVRGCVSMLVGVSGSPQHKQHTPPGAHRHERPWSNMQVAIMDTLSNVDGKRLVWVPKVKSASPAAAAQQGSGVSSSGSGDDSSDDSYKGVAIAGLVLGCVSMLMALALVAHRLLPASSSHAGPTGNKAPLVPCMGAGCADPGMVYVKHVDQEMGGLAVAPANGKNRGGTGGASRRRIMELRPHELS